MIWSIITQTRKIIGEIMNKFFLSIFLLSVSAVLGYYGYYYLNGKLSAIIIYCGGITFGMFLMFLKLKSKNDRLNSYKRELERESVTSDNAEAKVKVLESKIQVLEKALENALSK